MSAASSCEQIAADNKTNQELAIDMDMDVETDELKFSGDHQEHQDDKEKTVTTKQVQIMSPTTIYRTNPMSPPIIITTSSPSLGSRPGTPLLSELDTDQVDLVGKSSKHTYEVDDEFNIPVSVALLILMAYMMAGYDRR